MVRKPGNPGTLRELDLTGVAIRSLNMVLDIVTGDPACVESDHPAAAVTCLYENCAGVWCFNCRGGNLRCPVCGGQGTIIDSFRRPPFLASKPRRKAGAR